MLSIQEALNKGKGKVKLHGWVYRERKSKQIVFIVLRDSSNIVQCVVKKDAVSEKEWEIAQKILIESSVELEGEIKEDSRAPTGYEIVVDKLNLISMAEPFPITKDQSKEFLADNRHLWLRSRRMIAIMKIRSTVFGAIHEYFRDKGFYEHQSPIFQSTQCEGGSTLFKLNYFGDEVFLAQTWQLYAEPMIFALEKVYTIAPSFRAEKSKTSRHLTEYWHAEMEVAWEGFSELQEYAEELVKFVFDKVMKVNKQELEILERDLSKLRPVIDKPFKRMTYSEALDVLKKKNNMDVKWGKDLRTVEEDELVKNYGVPVIVTCYPKEVKAFYMKENPDDPRTVFGFDLLAPEGYGEIVGASEREVDLEELKKKLKEEGEDLGDYSFYLDTRRYGSVPHSGFGMGVERLISWICGLENIKDAIAFPRTPLRHKP